MAVYGHTQSIFYKTYGGNGFDTGNDVIQMESDSSFYIAGSSSSSGDAPSKAMLLHVDQHGEFLASYFYGGTRSDIGVRVMHKPGVGFWIAGYSNSFSEDANFDFYLVKINEQYEVEWQKTYGTSNWERLHDAILLPDEGVLLVGEVQGNGVEGKDAYLVRTNAIGEMEWQETYSGSLNDVAYSCALFDNESFLVGGSWGVADWNAWLAKFDLDGNVIWSRNDYLTDRVGEIREIRLTEGRINFYGNWSPLPYAENTQRKYQGVAHLNNELINNVFENGTNETHKSFAMIRTNRFYGVSEENNPDFAGDGIPRAAIFGNEGGGYYIGFSHEVYGNQVNPERLIRTLDTCILVVGTISDPSYSAGGANVVLLKITEETASLETVNTNQILSIDNFEDTGVLFYPNPTENTINVQVSHNEVGMYFYIINAQGQKVMEGPFSQSIELSNLSPGMYVLQISTNLGLRTTRIQKN